MSGPGIPALQGREDVKDRRNAEKKKALRARLAELEQRLAQAPPA